MSFWSCVKTHPNQERIAIQHLRNQDFQIYQPKILESKVSKGKFVTKESGLFPCYLFVYIRDRWASINSTHGVSRLLMVSGAPVVVGEDIIDSLRQRETGGYIKLPKRIALGDTVTIKEGPFTGQQGLVEKMPAKERQKMLLSLLNGNAKVLIAETALVAA